MIQYTPGDRTLTVVGLSADELSKAITALAMVGIEHDRLTLTQDLITEEVEPEQEPMVSPERGDTFLGHPVEWYNQPAAHHDEMAQCNVLDAYPGRTVCILPAFHELPPLSIPHRSRDYDGADGATS